MRLSCMRRLAVFAAFAAPLSLLSASATATPSLEINSGEVVVMDGTVRFKEVIVHTGGTLRVRSLTAGEGGSGFLLIEADSINVEQGGVIDATGAGFPGTGTAGDAPSCGAN